jgi:hypothetical protein
VVVMDLRPSQRETSEMGTPSASAVLAKVCRIIMKRRVIGKPGRRDGWLPDMPVVVVAAQESAPRRAAQNLGCAQAQLISMRLDGMK